MSQTTMVKSEPEDDASSDDADLQRHTSDSSSDANEIKKTENANSITSWMAEDGLQGIIRSNPSYERQINFLNNQFEESTARPEPDRGKQLRMRLPRAVEQELRDWYRKNRLFYDFQHKEHKNLAKRRALLAEMAEEMSKKHKLVSFNGASLHRWFRGIRGRWHSSFKVQSGSKPKRLSRKEKWIVENFSFLGEFVMRKCRETQMNYSGKPPPDVEESDDDSGDDALSSRAQSSEATTSSNVGPQSQSTTTAACECPKAVEEGKCPEEKHLDNAVAFAKSTVMTLPKECWNAYSEEHAMWTLQWVHKQRNQTHK